MNLKKIELFFDSIAEKKYFYPALLCCFTFIALLPLLIPGIPKGHDIMFHMARLKAIADGLANGYPVYINPDAIAGYGYATGLFYPDVFLVPFAFLHKMGLPIVTTYKVFLTVWALFNVSCMYFTARRISRNSRIAFTASILYAFSSYMASDMFIRAALGEFLAFPFFVLAVLGAYELIYGDPKRFLPFVFGLAGIVLTHNITLVLALIIFAIWFGCNICRFIAKPSRIFYTLFAGTVAMAISALYWLPMLEQLASQTFYMTTKTLASSIVERAVPITRLFLELPYMRTEFWHPAGIGTVFVLLIGLRMAFHSKYKQIDKVRDTFLIIGVGCLLCSTNLLPWEGSFSKLGMIQFPWRFYMPALVFLSLGGALTVQTWTARHPERRVKWSLIVIVFCAFAWFLNIGYIYAAKIHEKNILKTFTQKDSEKLAGGGLHYLPSSAELEYMLKRGNIATVSDDNIEFKFQRNDKTCEIEFEHAEPHGDFVVTLPLVWYKGFAAKDETGKSHATTPSDNGLLTFAVKECDAKHKFKISYIGTNIQKASICVTLAALAVTICATMLSKRIMRKRRKSNW